MRKLILFVIFAGLFVCAAGIVIAVSTGLVDPWAIFPNLPEPPEITTGRFPLPGAVGVELPDLDLPQVQWPGQQVLVPEQVQRRSLVAGIPAPQQIVLAPQVVGTNVGLAILMALVFGATSAVLGNMIREEEPRLRAWLQWLGVEKLAGWLARVFQWSLARAAIRRGCLTLPIVVVIFALYGIIFAFLETGTSILSREGAFLAVTMAFSTGLVSFGGDIARRIAGRLWREDSRFNLYPANLLVAIVTVILSRLLNLSPGIAFGAPGGAEVDIPPEKQHQRESTLAVLEFTVLALLMGLGWVAGGAVLAMLGRPFDERIIGSAARLLTAVQNGGLVLFMVALETLFFGMLPVAYSMGQTLFRWNKMFWGVTFLPVAFLFNHTLLNPQSGFLDSFLVSNVRFMWFVLFVFTGVTAGLWFYFNIVDDVLKDMLGMRSR
jgi:hypothetical protein